MIAVLRILIFPFRSRTVWLRGRRCFGEVLCFMNAFWWVTVMMRIAWHLALRFETWGTWALVHVFSLLVLVTFSAYHISCVFRPCVIPGSVRLIFCYSTFSYWLLSRIKSRSFRFPFGVCQFDFLFVWFAHSNDWFCWNCPFGPIHSDRSNTWV